MSVVANVAINVDSRGATQKLREVQSQAQQTERAFGGVAAAAGKLAAAFSVIQAARFVFASTAELQSQTRSLQVLTGSAEKATSIIRELQQLGAVTPFTSAELIDSAKRLQAFGIEADKVVSTTKQLADVSGATGAELQGLVTAYGQVQAKGRLQGEELLQFQERGVALQQILREEYKLSGEEFQDALEKGRISAEAVEFALQKLTDAGGKYADGAVAQSDTLSGRLSTLQDNVQNLASRLGQILEPAMQSILGLAIDIANQVNSVFETILLQRQLGANLPASQRDRLFKQAGQEAEQIARLRGGGTINADEFTKVREERFRDLLRTYGYQQGILTPPKNVTPADRATLPGLLSPRGGAGGRKGKSEAEREAERLAKELQRSLEIGDQLGTQFSRQAILLGEESEIERQRFQIQFDYQDRAKQISELKNTEQQTNLNQLNAEIQRLELIDLQTEALKKQAEEADKLFKAAFESAEFGVSGGGPIASMVADMEQNLRDFLAPVNQVKVAATAIGDAFSSSFKDIITGAKSAQEAIADFFGKIGEALIDYATQAISQYIAIGIARLFAGLDPLAASNKNLSGTGALSGGKLFPTGAFAEGGFVTGPTRALIGEGGEPEYVIPASKMRGAMNRYSAGARGSGVIPSGSGDGATMGATMTAAPIDVRYTVERINSVDYVTADQFQAGMRQAASQGAERGQQLALRRLQQSPSARRRVGI